MTLLGQSIALLSVVACQLARGQQLLTSGRIGGDVDPQTGLAKAPLVLSWPGTVVRTAFENSKSVQVKLQAQAGFPSAANSTFRFVLDGQAEQVTFNSQNLPGTWTKQGLSLDTHELAIIKLTEALYGIVILSNISLEQAGRYAKSQTSPCCILNLADPFLMIESFSFASGILQVLKLMRTVLKSLGSAKICCISFLC